MDQFSELSRYFQVVVGAVGEDVVLFGMVVLIGSTFYFAAFPVARVGTQLGVKSGQWMYRKVANDIWDRVMAVFRKRGWIFDGFTQESVAIALVLPAVVFAWAKIAMKAPSAWQLWLAVLLVILAAFSVYGYHRSGPRITVKRFVSRFYNPTFLGLGFLVVTETFERITSVIAPALAK